MAPSPLLALYLSEGAEGGPTTGGLVTPTTDERCFEKNLHPFQVSFAPHRFASFASPPSFPVFPLCSPILSYFWAAGDDCSIERRITTAVHPKWNGALLSSSFSRVYFGRKMGRRGEPRCLHMLLLPMSTSPPLSFVLQPFPFFQPPAISVLMPPPLPLLQMPLPHFLSPLPLLFAWKRNAIPTS